MKKLLMAVLVIGLWGMSVGCDETALPDDLSKLVSAAKGMQSGDLDQVRQQDQLRDGTGVNCPKTATTARGTGDQTQSQLRLRDGTGKNCPG